MDTAKPESVLVITATGAATGIWGGDVGVRDIKCLLHLVEQSFTMINDKSPRYMQVCVCVCVCVVNLRDTEYTYPLCGGK